MQSFQSVAQGLPILDASFIPPTGPPSSCAVWAVGWLRPGVTLLEYRNKTGAETELLADAAILRAALPSKQVKLIPMTGLI